MYNNTMDSIKNDLKGLCEEYLDILERLKNENIITDDIYKECRENKIDFIDL